MNDPRLDASPVIPLEVERPDDQLDLSVVDRIIQEKGSHASSAIPILQAIQNHFRFLPREALLRVCDLTDISAAQIAGIATFYAQFRHLPVGEHLISVCHGTACHVAGAEAVTESVNRLLKLGPGVDTDKKKQFTVQKVGCLGCCTLAPVMRIDDRTYGHVTRDSVPRILQEFLEEEKQRPHGPRAGRASRPGAPEIEIRIGLGSCCVASGSQGVRDALTQALVDLGGDARVKCGGCVGMCHRVPLLEFVHPGGQSVRYGNVTPDRVRPIVIKEVRPSGLRNRIKRSVSVAKDRLFSDASWQDPSSSLITEEVQKGCSFLSRQKHVVLEGCGEMDPLDLDEYLAHEGFQGLERALKTLSPEEVAALVAASGLRGRGGAGFPTGRKWEVVRLQPGEPKYVVMNGDEGDPGAFMDRMLLESYPYRVLEGLAIASYAVGAQEGYLYIRAEYPLAVARIREAVSRAMDRGILGPRILGTEHSLKLHLMEGAGAFVCGEETGLIASIEGRRGMPRFRPPFPAQSGLWGKPTSINNVETCATVPWILRHGAEAFSAMGTEKSKGTKVFALAGRVERSGLIEVPMGITVREIVEDIGAGIKDGGTFKAVQIGGPSGGCIPARLADTRIDYEELRNTGAIMGSGGLVVMDEATCMVDIARFFLQFTQNESCGKCTFCRVGTKRMLEILDRLCQGHGTHQDIPLLETLAGQIKKTSLCGLGQTAPNPVLTTLKYYREEYEAHVKGHCPAKRCRALIRYRITEKCIGCTLCAQNCPAQAIEMRPYERHEIDQTRCVRCGTCRSVCPEKALEVE